MNRIFSKCDSIVDTFFKRSLSHRGTRLVGFAGGTGGYIFGPWVAKYWRGSNCCHYLRQKNKSPPIQSPSLFKRPKLMYICDETIIIFAEWDDELVRTRSPYLQTHSTYTEIWWTMAKLEYTGILLELRPYGFMVTSCIIITVDTFGS